VALGAPRLFNRPLELPLGLVACAALAAAVLWRLDPVRAQLRGRRRLIRLGAAGAVLALAGTVAWQEGVGDPLCRFRGRNFYGTLTVVDDPPDAAHPLRTLMHGVIEHGAQPLDPAWRSLAVSYYGPGSGVARAIRACQARGPVRLGVVGLGAGCLCAYARPGDRLRIYELNPLVERVALEQFSYFRDAPADKRIILGDARLSLEAEPPQGFDLLAVDAFSGDAIPVHLLTAEALAVYFRHLRPGGVLALHLSNRYLDLAPVGAAGAALFRRTARQVLDPGQEAMATNPTDWLLVTDDPALFQAQAFRQADLRVPAVPPGFRPWTDAFSNLVRVLRR